MLRKERNVYRNGEVIFRFSIGEENVSFFAKGKSVAENSFSTTPFAVKVQFSTSGEKRKISIHNEDIWGLVSRSLQKRNL